MVPLLQVSCFPSQHTHTHHHNNNNNNKNDNSLLPLHYSLTHSLARSLAQFFPCLSSRRDSEAKGIFDRLETEYFALELDEIDEGPDVQDALADITGIRTVPQVFVGGKLIGGCDGKFLSFLSFFLFLEIKRMSQ